jgi:hypothetical protein
VRHRPAMAVASMRSWLTAVAIAAAALCAAACARAGDSPVPLLIAPIVAGAELCEVGTDAAPPRSKAELVSYCRDSGRSAAAILEPTLSALGPPLSPSGRFEVGYTLPVPLLAMLRRNESAWAVDQRAIDRIALTIRETNRPAIIYLFSTHFAADAPIENELFEAGENVAVTPAGPMARDKYHGTDIFPWTFVSTENSITRYRQAVIGSLLEALCRLPAPDRRKIRALTLLGELHHYHADFERGMGVGGPYVVSDYSAASVRGFRKFLAARFGTVEALNRAVGGSFASFAQVDPPARDIRAEPVPRLLEHIDSFAHGRIPLIGWAFDPARPAEPVWVRIYRNSELVARVPARFGRQDVLQARPSFGTADVGWRFDLDFTTLPPGTHRLDFLAERPGGELASIGSRRIAIAGRGPPADGQGPVAGLMTTAAGDLEAHVDQPQDLKTYIFNPLVPLWHEFRGDQVVRYLAHFERQVRASCLRDHELYTHQIAPFANPSWDATKFAVDASLQAAGGLRLGVSLYGEPIYGTSFFDWLATSKHRRYGITEFHPLREMSPDEMRSTLQAHRQRGARFLSFFLDARPLSMRTESQLNVFGIEPGNRNFGSDKLYEAFRTVVNE